MEKLANLLWAAVRPTLLKKHRQMNHRRSEVHLLDTSPISKILPLGPKFAVEPSLSTPELSALNRNVASKAVVEEEEGCIQERACSLVRTVQNDKNKFNLWKV